MTASISTRELTILSQYHHLYFPLQIGLNIWNNLVEPPQHRSSVYDYRLPVKCPTWDRPFVSTSRH